MRKHCLVKSFIVESQNLDKFLLEVSMGIGNSTFHSGSNLFGIEI